jgi:hypothetical protein
VKQICYRALRLSGIFIIVLNIFLSVVVVGRSAAPLEWMVAVGDVTKYGSPGFAEYVGKSEVQFLNEPSDQLLARRLAILIICMGAGLGLTLLSWGRFDDGRPLFGAALLGGGVLLGLSGLGLWFATAFSFTLGWPI